MILAIDASGAQAGVALLAGDGAVLARRFLAGRPGLIETLPVLVGEMLGTAKPELLAVGTGPGSFTGLRTSIALAQGYAAAAGVPVYGVAGDLSYAQGLPGLPGLERALWVAVRARRGWIFLIRDGVVEAFADADLPRAGREKMAVAGDAAREVAAHLAAAGGDVMLTDARAIDPVWVGLAALAQRARGEPPYAAQPVYVDAPEAKLPAGGLRPAPV